jgi:hypothetical protein
MNATLPLYIAGIYLENAVSWVLEGEGGGGLGVLDSNAFLDFASFTDLSVGWGHTAWQNPDAGSVGCELNF